MTDLLFGQSYFLCFDPKLWAAMQPYPPLGSLYAASYLRSRGYEVAFFDAMLAGSEDEWARALDQSQPRFAVLYEDNFNYLSKMCLLRMRQAAFTMIEMARQRGCTVVVSGADASDHAEQYLEQGADYVLTGEGEYTLAELVDALTGRSTQALEDILGMTWRGIEGLQRTLRRPDIRDLDSLPFPAWDLVDISHYRQVWQERHGYYAMNMVTTRGCPFHCNWCAKPIWGQRYNTRSPQNVVAELKWLKETYHPDMISFVDDIFGLKPGWLATFAEQVEAEDASLPFKCLSRVDLLLRDGEIDALRCAGARTIWVGAESGAQKILDAMDKGTRVEQIYQATQKLHQAGLQVGFFLQFGYPGETRQDIEKTLQMVRDCQPDDIGMSVSYPLPGTKFYQAVKDQLGAQQHWYDSQDLAMLYRGPYSTAFYRQLHTTLHCEFRASKAWGTFRRRDGTSAQLSSQSSSRDHQSQPQLFRRLYALVKFLTYRLRLPWERWKLKRLESAPHQGIAPLPPLMRPEEAAQPTMQEQ
jgi:anaerobic magnesium-protoporphyrin IX monomethyl ester cyclase